MPYKIQTPEELPRRKHTKFTQSAQQWTALILKETHEKAGLAPVNIYLLF
jgi:hypothetical protein